MQDTELTYCWTCETFRPRDHDCPTDPEEVRGYA